MQFRTTGEFNLNLNEREKVRFSKQFENMAEISTKLSEAIKSGNNEDIFSYFIIFTMAFDSLREFKEIIVAELKKKAEQRKSEDFPDLIFDKRG